MQHIDTGQALRGQNPAPLRASSAVHIEDLYKSYGSGDERRMILDNIDLSIPHGEFVSLVGPSGCGKSTLFRMILGQELPDRGILNIGGTPANFVDQTRGIVFQKYTSLFPHLTVLGNVTMGLRLSMGPLGSLLHRKEANEEAMTFLKRVGLAEHADKFPYELSGGMCQRVAIAQALVMRPTILLMDEPFSALDATTRESAQVFLLELWEQTGTTILFVTHNIEEAVFLGTRIVALSQYYRDDRSNGSPRGSRIVFDRTLPRSAQSTAVKATAEFGEIVAEAKKRMDPKSNEHVNSFNLSHPCSFQTFASGEVAEGNAGGGS